MKNVGYVGVDGALPARKNAREALWEVSGSKEYPQVFIDKRYVGDFERVMKMNEEDVAHEEAMKKRKEKDEASGANRFGERKQLALPKGVGFKSTFAAFLGQEALAEDKTLSYR